jgi:WD40 repeat protein
MPTIAPVEAGVHVEWAGFLDGRSVFALADGQALFVDGGERLVRLHEGLSVAAACPDGPRLATGGEDGSVALLSGDGSVNMLRAATGKWVDAIACGPSGAVAAASGRVAEVFQDGGSRQLACERSIEGLAFAPKGMRLAAARYNGVDLYWVNTGAAPQFLEWKGAHVGVTFSPDGQYVVTSMQENALHGWRISDGRHMRMTGYPAKVKSLSWAAKGRHLASSGAPAAIVWPFSGKDGPMGKPPRELGSMGQTLATQVACHPSEDVVAIGYADGLILAARIEDGKAAALRRSGGSAVSALNWDRQGRRLAFGCEGGEAGIIDLAT